MKKYLASFLIIIILETAMLLFLKFSEYLTPDIKLVCNITTMMLFILNLWALFAERISLCRGLISLKVFLVILLAILYFLDLAGIWETVSDVASLRKFINSLDNKFLAIVIFIIIQFLQVVIIPIPGSVTVLVGTLLFGPFWGGVFSVIGIVSGSIVAFLIGRKFGSTLVEWIIGKEELEKLLRKLQGRDKVMFFLMILLPLFPDDVLCFVAGITTMSLTYFSVVILITRIFTIFVQSYFSEFVQGLFVYNLTLGIVVCAILAIGMMLLFYYGTKYGDRIETSMKNLFTKKKKNDIIE